MSYYNESEQNRLFVDCGANLPIGTLPAQTDDHYMQFYIGMEDGGILRDNSDPSGNYPHFGDCPSGQTAEFCAGWKFGWNNDEALINPSEPVDSKCYADSIKQPNLVGTRNIVNETKGADTAMKMDDMNNMTGTSGTITFTKQQYNIYQPNTWNYTETINGKTARGTWDFNDPTNTMVNLW